MHIADSVLKSVVFIGFGTADGPKTLSGTGFLIGVPIDAEPQYKLTYLVTAKHVIEGPKSMSANAFFVRANMLDGKAEWFPFSTNNLMYHPTDETTDVVACRSNVPKGADHMLIPSFIFTTPELMKSDNIMVGDTVSIVGLFANHHGEVKNTPIVRTGNLAVLDEQKIVTNKGPMDAYLIEARSIGGISGSPVFLNPGSMRVLEGQLKIADNPRIHLFGLIHGHFNDVDEEHLTPQEKNRRAINTGIAIVVPIRKVAEIILPDAAEQLKDIQDAET